MHKGLKDLLALGWIDTMPRIYGVQAAGSNFMAEAWQAGLFGLDVLKKAPINSHTVADSISAGLPRDRIKAMAAVVDTGGAYVVVSDDEILAAIPVLARGCGVFAEPAGAAGYAGLVKAVAQGLVSPDDRIVVINTGSVILVTHLTRYHPSHSTPWTGSVPIPSRNQVYVGMEDCLPSGFTRIYTNIESGYCPIRFR